MKERREMGEMREEEEEEEKEEDGRGEYTHCIYTREEIEEKV